MILPKKDGTTAPADPKLSKMSAGFDKVNWELEIGIDSVTSIIFFTLKLYLNCQCLRLP
jgi:hypothetical protein